MSPFSGLIRNHRGTTSEDHRAHDPYEENGRLYHGFHKGIYLLPCDEVS